MFEVVLLVTLQIFSWIDDIRVLLCCLFDCFSWCLCVMFAGNLALLMKFEVVILLTLLFFFSWIDDISVLCCSFGYFYEGIFYSFEEILAL